MCVCPIFVQYIQIEWKHILYSVLLLYTIYLKIWNPFRPHMNIEFQNRHWFVSTIATIMMHQESMLHCKWTSFVWLRKIVRTVTLISISWKRKVIYFHTCSVWHSSLMIFRRAEKINERLLPVRCHWMKSWPTGGYFLSFLSFLGHWLFSITSCFQAPSFPFRLSIIFITNLIKIVLRTVCLAQWWRLNFKIGESFADISKRQSMKRVPKKLQSSHF